MHLQYAEARKTTIKSLTGYVINNPTTLNGRAIDKRRRENAGDLNAAENVLESAKMQAVLAETQKMILTKLSIELYDHDRALLWKELRFAPTPVIGVDNAECWLNAYQHVRRANGVKLEKRMM